MTIKQKLGEFLYKTLPFSTETLNQVRYEMQLFFIWLNTRLNPVFKYRFKQLRNENSISLNIGASPFGENDWINVDLQKNKNINLIYDFRRKIPFNNNSIERIRIEHCLEHFDYDLVPNFFNECCRVLKPHCILRIIVPDTDKYIAAYYSNDLNEWTKIGIDAQYWKPIHQLNHVFRQKGEHKYAYNFELINELAKNAGFTNVIKQEFGKSTDEKLRNDLPGHKLYSLYVDCIK